MESNLANTQTQVIAAKSAIERLLDIRTLYEKTISELKPKVQKLLAQTPTADLKDNALKGVKIIAENIDTLKDVRLIETRKIDEIKSFFTSLEKELLELKNNAQAFADKCLQEQMKEEKERQLKEAAKMASLNELQLYKNKCRDNIITAIADVRIEAHRLIRYVMDNCNPELGAENLISEIKKITLPKLKNKLPVFNFNFNTGLTEDNLKGMYKEVYDSLDSEIKKLNDETGMYIQEAILLVPDFIKSALLDAESAKKTLEAREVLNTVSVQQHLEEAKNDNAITDVLQSIDAAPTEIVIDSKRVVSAEIVSHAALISAVKWYAMQPEYQKKPLESLGKVSLDMMLTLAKKHYEKDNTFELNGVEFEIKEKAK